LVTPYLKALSREIVSLKEISTHAGISFEQIAASEIDTIYFGGGTPSFIPGEEMLALMTLVRQTFRIAPAAEVTIEVNPGSADSRKIDFYLKAGVNRVSIGMQTFQDDLLKRIGRSHQVKDALHTFDLFWSRGLRNMSLDLIAGLPGQTLEDWQENLSTVASLSPEHISMYLLEIHENTQFGKIYDPSLSGAAKPVEDRPDAELPPEDLVEQLYLESIRFFSNHGYRQYEISNFAKPGRESRHNLKYWTGRPYLGLGCSAHSCFGGKRWSNERSVGSYIQLIQRQSHAVDVQASLSALDRQEEAIFLGLRLTEGLDLAEFRENFGFSFPERYQKQMDYLQEGDLIAVSADRLWLTLKGCLLSNEVFTELLR
jgi:oxygen-independent coproporphyrinogen-3 oxidase